jgi:mannose-6-phosphate isomerase
MVEGGVLTLLGVVQHYDWGGHNFIPDLLGVENSTRRPFAELWIGAHAKAPSLAKLPGGLEPLDELIAENPEAILGAAANTHFRGRLPYLFKILDVHKMLSIQAHPTLIQASEGFARENENYKDDNHKPEIGVALTEFWMLHGFRPLEQIAEAFDQNPELGSLMPDFASKLAAAGHDHDIRRGLLRSLYSNLMTMPQDAVDSLLNPLLAHPGQATFQPAGVLHAYLEGVNVELMANSDNVMRGGLTTKHVDVPELLRILTFEGGTPEVIDGTVISKQERVYRTPAEEFELSRISVAAGDRYTGEATYGPKAMMALQGAGSLTAAGRSLSLKRGSIAFAPCGAQFVIEAKSEDLIVFQAGLPRHARGAA